MMMVRPHAGPLLQERECDNAKLYRGVISAFGAPLRLGRSKWNRREDRRKSGRGAFDAPPLLGLRAQPRRKAQSQPGGVRAVVATLLIAFVLLLVSPAHSAPVSQDDSSLSLMRGLIESYSTDSG